MLVLENSPNLRRSVSFSEDTLIDHAIKSENVDELTGIFDREGTLSPNAMTLQGESPLHVSVRKDRLNSTKVLIEQGADVNVQDDEGQTALHYSIGNDNIDMTTLLLGAGADLFRHDDKGILPTALVKSTTMKKFLNDKIFEATMANLHRVLNSSEESQPVTNRLGSRHFSDTDLMTCGYSGKRRTRSRSLSDSGLQPECSQLKSILKKNSSFEPRVSLIREIRESEESLSSMDGEGKHRQPCHSPVESVETVDPPDQGGPEQGVPNQPEVGDNTAVERKNRSLRRKSSIKRSNFLFRAFARTRHKFNMLINR